MPSTHQVVPTQQFLETLGRTLLQANVSLTEAGQWARTALTRAALLEENGNNCRAASRLRIHRNTLSRWIERSPELRRLLHDIRHQRRQPRGIRFNPQPTTVAERRLA